nr:MULTISPECIES: GNAT family N-acetyltransferase [unclassified Roseibium]
MMSHSAEITITLTKDSAKGRYVAVVAGIDEPAELTFSIVSDHMIIADHTGVPDSMRGMGVGKALVERLVADARENSIKIVPLCPYVNAQRQKHPEWADVFQG